MWLCPSRKPSGEGSGKGCHVAAGWHLETPLLRCLSLNRHGGRFVPSWKDGLLSNSCLIPAIGLLSRKRQGLVAEMSWLLPITGGSVEGCHVKRRHGFAVDRGRFGIPS